MGHVTAERDWGTVDVNTTTGVILLREDWRYGWRVLGVGLSPWTYEEERSFHRRLDREIWGRWSAHFPVQVSGTSPFAKRFAHKTLKLEYDIHWVLHKGQWQVTVYKVQPGTDPNIARAFVTPAKRTVTLYTTIFRPYTAGNDAGMSRPEFVAGPHEFGHTMNNPDEYLGTSPFVRDADSIMNVGRQVRARHLHQVIDLLNTMIPGTTFSV